MITQLYKNKNLNIILSLIDNIISIKIVDNITCKIYENNIQLQCNKYDIFNIICNCFEEKNNQCVYFLIKEYFMIITLNIEYIHYFDIILKEKNIQTVIEEIKDLSNTMQTLIKQNSKNKKLDETIKLLKSIIEYLCGMDEYMSISHGVKDMSVLDLCLYVNNIDEKYNISTKIQYFYQLNKLIIGSLYTSSNINFSNKTLKTLIICTKHLSSLENLNNLPVLEEIEFRCCNLTDANNIIPYLHKNIKKIVFLFGYGKPIINKLFPYCKKNNIELVCL
jgi:hypothetical protein